MRKKTFTEKKIVAAARHNRPRCLQCDRLMEPQYEHQSKRYRMPDGFHTHSTITGVNGYGYSADSRFCTLRCGFDWADNHARRR